MSCLKRQKTKTDRLVSESMRKGADMTQSEKRRKLSGDITTELCGLSGLSQVLNTSENEALFALADLLGPAVNRLLNLIEELEQAS